MNKTKATGAAAPGNARQTRLSGQPAQAKLSVASSKATPPRPLKQGSPSPPPAYRPQPTPKVLQAKPATPRGVQTTAARPRVTAAPAQRPQPAVVQTKKMGGPQPRVCAPSRPHVAPPAYSPVAKRVVQPKMAAGLSRGVIQRETPQARRLRLRAVIATHQGIVEGQRDTINSYSNNGNLNVGLRRGQLQSLIAALDISIPARQIVHDTHTALGDVDPGNHQGWIVVENNLRTAAQNDLNTLHHHAATAWAANALRGGNWQIRTLARWDRDPVQTEERENDPDGAFVVVRRRR